MLEKGLKHISRTVVQPDNFALTNEMICKFKQDMIEYGHLCL